MKIQNKGQVTIPTRVREQAGLKAGDTVEFSYKRGAIIITPKVVTSRSASPGDEVEETPAQRRIIDREIAKGLADVKNGHTFGPFDTADDMIAAMRAELAKRSRAAKKPKRSA